MTPRAGRVASLKAADGRFWREHQPAARSPTREHDATCRWRDDRDGVNRAGLRHCRLSPGLQRGHFGRGDIQRAIVASRASRWPAFGDGHGDGEAVAAPAIAASQRQ